MNIFRPDFHPPQTFESEAVVIFPTNEAFYLSDHEAVMRSKEGLRVWSQSPWPEDSFTPEQNREDLLLHVADNKNHEAYGYMIYSPDRKTCFGSLYVNPLAGLSENYSLSAAEAQSLGGFDARLDYWVVDGEPALEKQITESVRDWLNEGWNIQPLFACRREMRERQAIYQSLGFELFLDLTGKSPDSNLMLFKLAP
jgi:hypothetical protein